MNKTVKFGAKPNKTVVTPSLDTWVEQRNVEGTKRLTLDIPASLHTRIKTSCAARGLKITDEVRELLEKHFSGNV